MKKITVVITTLLLATICLGQAETAKQLTDIDIANALIAEMQDEVAETKTDNDWYNKPIGEALGKT